MTRVNEIVTIAIAALSGDECALLSWGTPYPTFSVSPMAGSVKTGTGSWVRRGRAHVLICTIMHGPRPDGAHALHSCHRPRCVNPSHLRWGTHTDNMNDSASAGGFNRSLTPTEAKAIRTNTVDTGVALARRYNVTPTTISRIRSGKTWRHI